MSVLPALVQMPGFDCCNKLLFCECEKSCQGCLNMPMTKQICYGFIWVIYFFYSRWVLSMARAIGAAGLVAERWTPAMSHVL